MDIQDLEQSTPYKLGQMDTRLMQVEKDLAEVKTDVKTLVAALNQQKGGRTTIAAWGGGGVTVGGLVVAAAQWLGIGGHAPAPAPAQPPVIIQQQQPQADPTVRPSATTQF